MSIGQLAAPIASFATEMYIYDVDNYLKRNEEAVGAVIVSEGVKMGLNMRDRLFQQLADQ